MIPRYSLKEMSSIWEENNKFNIWFKIEKLVCEAQVKLGIVPSDVAKRLSGTIQFDINRIKEIESTVKHDVIAFISYIAEKVEVDVRYLHYGMTSSDVLDTCLAVQLKESCDILLKNLQNLLVALKKKLSVIKVLCVLDVVTECMQSRLYLG